VGGAVNWATAKYANGPMVAAWLDERGISFHGKTAEAKRLIAWRSGGMADVYALDRMLINTKYGLWELPDEVWLEARRPQSLRSAA